MLTALTTRSAKLAPLGKTLEQVTDKAASVATQARRDHQARGGARRPRQRPRGNRQAHPGAEGRRAQAEQTTQKALGPDGELQKHREAVQHLSSQALQTQATLDTLKKERAALEELRVKLRESEHEVKQATLQAGHAQRRARPDPRDGDSLTQDYAKIRETSREAREDTTAAMTTVKEVEKKLGPLAQLHELSQSTEERLTSLNALAEHVSHKAKALESQQQAVEHAVVQANRVNEMVWAMDVQIGKLNEGHEAGGQGRRDHRPHREAVGRHRRSAWKAPRSSIRKCSARPRSSRRIRRCCSRPCAPKSARWRSGSRSSRRSTSGCARCRRR